MDSCFRFASRLIPAVVEPCRVHLVTIAVRRRPERPTSVVPDVLVTCEARVRGQLYVTAPKLVIEVMSRSSVSNDLLRKPLIYGAIESIQEYLVIDSRDTWARVFRRDDDERLTSGEDHTTLDSRIALRSVGLTLTLAELYDGVL